MVSTSMQQKFVIQVKCQVLLDSLIAIYFKMKFLILHVP